MIGLIITLIVIGVLMWLVNTYIPMDANIKKILNVVVIILVVLWILSIFVDFGSLGGPLPRYHLNSR
jgi:hypothetical protein